MKYVKSILAAALTVSVMTVGAPAQAASTSTNDTNTSTNTAPAPAPEQTAAQKAAAKKKAAAEKRKKAIAKRKAALKKKRALAAKKKRIAAKKKAARGAKIVRVAAKYKGTPYVWGGTTPKGFDCSGYVQYVVKKAVGKKLPRIAGDQMRAAKKVSKSAKKKGDLIGFSNGGGYYHIGIYAGDGKIWHAPRTGETVKKVKIWTSGYTVARP
ncbi:C40 family peptidase [Aeromicrobium sp. 179-A 4D2 NHS]|uniref:C40 family peptidase n=1 Tax=Aeromicrobium sp. 179-A 4D2 NHS TaxID=3142375 RepID=UPI0039A2D11F